jgi:hypothetical protein
MHVCVLVGKNCHVFEAKLEGVKLILFGDFDFFMGYDG